MRFLHQATGHGPRFFQQSHTHLSGKRVHHKHYHDNSRRSFTSIFHTFTNYVADLQNPPIGHEIIQHQQPGIFYRLDGRCPDSLKLHNGLKARKSHTELLEIRQDDVAKYQQSNEPRIGHGACNNLIDILRFSASNDVETKNNWIHVFFRLATPLGHLKSQVGMEPHHLDSENEHLVVKHVPFSRIIASICPTYRTKFINGQMVPNAMAKFHHNMPKTVYRSDLTSELNILGWLLKNGADEHFYAVSQELFANMPEDVLMNRLERDRLLVAHVQLAIGSASTEPRNMLR